MFHILHLRHQVVKNKLVGKGFVWLFPGWFVPKWWTYGDTDCSADQMKSALDHSLGFRGNSEVTKNPSRVLVTNKVCTYIHLYFECFVYICSLEHLAI